jgi:mRNA interferase MazF
MDGHRRPALVLTRDAAVPVLHRVVAAPLTRTVRGIRSEVPLDSQDGLDEECAVSLDNVTVLPKAVLTHRVTTLSAARMHDVCRALAFVVDC